MLYEYAQYMNASMTWLDVFLDYSVSQFDDRSWTNELIHNY